jgi:hypothetical protein
MLFGTIEDSENLSVKEVQKIFNRLVVWRRGLSCCFRKPIQLSKEASLLLGRFCVEKRDNEIIDFNLNNEEDVKTIKARLQSILPPTYSNYTSKLQKQIQTNIKPVIVFNSICFYFELAITS